MLRLRDAKPVDAPGIAEIWNPIICNTALTFTSTEKSPDDVNALIKARSRKGRCFLVAENDMGVLGFASYDQFRAGNGYVHSMESTVILAERAQKQGIGRALMTGLEQHARNAGHHCLIAAISAENQDGIKFHNAIDFQPVGVIPDAGRKFDRWIDLHLMQKLL